VSEADDIKRIALVGLFSQNDLMGQLVFKGGSLLEIVYGVTYRASEDLDFSIQSDFDLDDIRTRVVVSLEKAFEEQGYKIFDVVFEKRPRNVPEEMKTFWGGYRIQFKVISLQQFHAFKHDMRSLRAHAQEISQDHRKKFSIDISGFEYCVQKKPTEVDGCTVYVYTPEMIVFEKLRAVCQQMPEYGGPTHRRGRAKDFFDIWAVLENMKVDLLKQENIHVLRNVFAAKRVPLRLIGRIKDFRDYHKQDFPSVQSTVRQTDSLKDFDFYFDYVLVNCCEKLKPFWEE
jgi:predicted nucleotidyltransferase component of viral defense system